MKEKIPMQALKDLLAEVKLHSFSENLETVINRFPKEREAILQTLTALAEAERSKRRERNIQYRIREAKFGQIQTVETFDFGFNPSTLKIKNRYLKLLDADMTQQGLSVLFVGTSGLGKTHLARALGWSLCQKGRRVRFATLSSMALDLITAEQTGTLKKAMYEYTHPALLILDEVGYVVLREPESNLVFQVLSQRYEARRSTAVTTNKPFGEWNQIFHNDAMAHAVIDRLVERSEVFHLEGKSYRETHRQRLKA
jgi:DNA replication protein DnaC